LRELWNCDQTGQISQIRTFVVELDKTVVLGIIS